MLFFCQFDHVLEVVFTHVPYVLNWRVTDRSQQFIAKLDLIKELLHHVVLSLLASAMPTLVPSLLELALELISVGIGSLVPLFVGLLAVLRPVGALLARILAAIPLAFLRALGRETSGLAGRLVT